MACQILPFPAPAAPPLPAAELAELTRREIRRCIARIAECDDREAAAAGDLMLRSAIDRDRDRAFASLRRATAFLKQLPETSEPEPGPAPAAEAPRPAANVIEMRPPVARNALCPCNSGEKYKRCCGRFAPPLPLREPRAA